jgi:hypothetical protein
MPSAMTTVVSLLFSGRPFAVLGRVRAVIINAFKGCPSKGNWPHVRTEVFEAMTPSSTDRNTSAPIVFPSGAVGVIASSLQSCPSVVKRGGRPTVFGKSLHAKLKIETAARLSRLSCERISSDNALCSAVAAAKPSCFAASRSSKGENCPSPELFSVNRPNWSRHARLINHKCGGFMTMAMGVPLV